MMITYVVVFIWTLVVFIAKNSIGKSSDKVSARNDALELINTFKGE